MHIHDYVIISDLHLGSKVCQSKQILKFLKEIKTKNLILNGDIFDSNEFKRLNKQEWEILSILRKLSKKINIIFILGNHDGDAEFLLHLLGIEFLDEYIFESGSKKILVLHGHIFDKFITKHPIVTFFADRFYKFMQKIHLKWAKNAKKYSKTFLRCSIKIEEDAKEYAKKLGCDIVCCGHTHHEVDHLDYYNSGCWTEIPHYLTINNGIVNLLRQ